MPFILGVRVDKVSRREAIQKIKMLMGDGQQHIVATPNPEMLVAAQKDAKFRDILNRSSLALPDGFGLMLAARCLGAPLPERIAGSDFVFDIARIAAEREHTMYLLGAGQGIADAAAEKLKLQFPNLKIVGAESGPINTPSPLMGEGWGEGVIEHINGMRPDILLVAFGHQRQEKWIAEHLHELPSVRIAMGVGGAFDFIAGHVARAPRPMRTIGLEWLWRLLLQPRRIVRIYRATIVFPLLVLRARLFNSK